ncbi:peptidoglycan-binding domain-containing protein [Streptomyces sp. MS1.HAVA.3]|uniref:Peptidoglycan-binding domain-containing protein n=1 Tax=Streptomyces caledonius TaxID=3134107 RepID=A0ABU8U9J9_9ACTN
MGAPDVRGERRRPGGREAVRARGERRPGRAVRKPEHEQPVPLGLPVAERLEVGVAVPVTERVPYLGAPFPSPSPSASRSSSPPPPAQAAILRYGDSGPEVERLQRLLAAQGLYRGKFDGEFGWRVERALSDFQYDRGIDDQEWGFYGPVTRKELEG